MQSTVLGLYAATPDHKFIGEMEVTVDSSEWGKLLLLHKGANMESLDLAGATFASVPDTRVPPLSLQITFSDGKSIVLSDRRSVLKSQS